MLLGKVRYIGKLLIGACIALALVVAPLQASVATDPSAKPGMMADMKMIGCIKPTCPCEKTKRACDMKLGCIAGCAVTGFQFHESQLVGMIGLSELSFQQLTESLVSIETIPLRRPPRL